MNKIKLIVKQQNVIVTILCFVMATFITIGCEEQGPWNSKEDPKAFDTVTVLMIDLNDYTTGWGWHHQSFPSHDGQYFDSGQVYVINSQEQFDSHIRNVPSKPNIDFDQYSVLAVCFYMAGDLDTYADNILLQTSDSTYKLSFTAIQSDYLITGRNIVLSWMVPKMPQNSSVDLTINYFNPYL